MTMIVIIALFFYGNEKILESVKIIDFSTFKGIITLIMLLMLIYILKARKWHE